VSFRTQATRLSAEAPSGGPEVYVRAEVEIPEEPVQPSVLLTHGAGGDLHTPGLKALSAGLARAGHLVVRADLPYLAAGRKTRPAAEKSVDGFIALANDARQRFGPDDSWVFGGRSYGGRVASMAVAVGLRAAGLLFYSYPLHRPGKQSELRVQHWPMVNVPSLFLEGTRDPFCDLELLDKHLSSLGAPATVHVIAGAEHTLKVPAAHAQGGKAQSEEASVEAVVPVVTEWLRSLTADPPR
jgi:predicted alpha/beta-hydrolase family hydrolase